MNDSREKLREEQFQRFLRLTPEQKNDLLPRLVGRIQMMEELGKKLSPSKFLDEFADIVEAESQVSSGGL